MSLPFLEPLRFHRITGVEPAFEAAENGVDSGKAVFEQDGRRTGALFFTRSGAVGDDPLVRVEFAQPRIQFGERNVDCARNALTGEGFR